MAQTINIDLRYNSTTQSNEGFVQVFRNDFAYCTSRFKAQVIFDADSKADKTLEYQFIVVSNSDFYDTSYKENLKEYVRKESNTFIIFLDPIKTKNDIISQQEFLCFNFWDQIVETGETRLFRKENKETQHLYWERIADIVFEILEHKSKETDKKGSVYLAQTDDSQNQERDNIRRDLFDLGFTVSPNRLINNNFDDSIIQINEALRNTNLIIHLIPSTYTEYFANKSLSIVEHQCNLSAKHLHSNHQNVQRIIWIPSDYEVVDEQNQIFIEKIQRDHDQSHNTLVLKVNLEDLKKIYRKILSGENVVSVDKDALPDLYVIADKEDTRITDQIDKEAKTAGLKLGINFTGISYNEHLKYLASAQVVVINYSQENQQWINVKVHDILKSPGLETSKPNKKLVLIKQSKDLETSHFEKYFNEVLIVEANDIKLNVL